MSHSLTICKAPGVTSPEEAKSLVVYDPQAGRVRPGCDEGEPTPGEIPQAVKGGASGLLLVGGGVLLPIPIVRWLMIGVGTFLVVMTVCTLVVLLRPQR